MTTQLYLHTDKTVICLQGDNPADFLNDLLTAQIEQLQQGIAGTPSCVQRMGRYTASALRNGETWTIRKKEGEPARRQEGRHLVFLSCTKASGG